jgi:hypothetical protein
MVDYTDFEEEERLREKRKMFSNYTLHHRATTEKRRNFFLEKFFNYI